MVVFKFLLFLFLFCRFLPDAYGQNNSDLVTNGGRYISAKIHNISSLNNKTARANKRLLKKLSKKEKRFAMQLKKSDTTAYNQYINENKTQSFDSLKKSDKGNHPSRKKSRSIDSLRKIGGFIEKNAGVTLDGKYGQTLNKLEKESNHQQYLQEQIGKRKDYLNKVATEHSSELKQSFNGIDKDIFYSRERLNNVKKIIDEPSAAEEKALEYLQGTEGFDQAVAMKNEEAISSGASLTDLEKMGYQTKSLLSKSIKGKFGGAIQNVKQRVGGDMSKWQDKMNDTKSAIRQSKQNLVQVKNLKQTSFKIDPIRCLPFSQRLIKQYNIQTRRAANSQPALLECSAMVGFKQTVRLSYGIGLAANFGLGQNWNNIKFSFQGAGYRTYLQWEWEYGFSAYAGYERMYKDLLFTNKNPLGNSNDYSVHNTSAFSENLLIGIAKSYKISAKWNGAVQVMYDIWWKEKNFNSPLILRFNTSK